MVKSDKIDVAFTLTTLFIVMQDKFCEGLAERMKFNCLKWTYRSIIEVTLVFDTTRFT